MLLGEFLSRLEGVYKSIDVRIAAVKSIDIWHNALMVIRFSCMPYEEIKKQQNVLESKWGKVHTDNFEIEMQAFPFKNLESLSQRLNDGKWSLLEIDKSEEDLIIGRGIDLLVLEGRFEKYGYTRRDSIVWPCFEATAGLNLVLEITSGESGKYCSLLDNDKLQSEVKSKTVIDVYTLISELLEVDFHKNLNFDFIVNAPFYAIIENVDFVGQKCKIQVNFHKDIKALAVSAVVRRGERDDTPLRDKARSLIKPEEAEELGEHMRLWKKEFDLLNATSSDYLSCNLIQTEPSALDIEKPSYSTQIIRYLESKEPAHVPLLAVFSRFCSLDQLEKYLTRPGEIRPPSPKKVSSAFEGFVLWVLGLCGFHSVWLGWTEHETLKEGKIEHLRLDILAYYERRNTLLLVQCTIGRPDQDIDIVNSIKQKICTETFKDTNIQIRGFIFSSQLVVDSAKQLGEKGGVKIFGGVDIKNILNCIKKGNMRDALAYFGF